MGCSASGGWALIDLEEMITEHYAVGDRLGYSMV
jgi:hypothetical protein